MFDSAGAAAGRAGEYVQRNVRRLSRRAQDMAQDAGDRFAEYTGRPLDTWTKGVRDFVREHPLQAMLITLGVGYIIGKILAARES